MNLGRRDAISLLTLAFFAPIAVGCVSNEYVIPNDELARLASLPPEVRGQRVHIIQEIGERHGDAIEPTPYYEAPGPDGYVQVQIDARGGGGPNGVNGGGGWRGPGASTSGGNGSWRGTATGSSGGGNGWRGYSTSSGGGSSSGGGWRGSSSSSSSSGGGWRGSSSAGSSSGGGGGGGSVGDNIGGAAVMLAVLLVVVAAVAVVGLIGSEGVRFDGVAEMHPGQPVHLHDGVRGDTVVALGDLTPAHVTPSIEAKVLDDEGYGIRRIEHVLNRKGGAFKLSFGRTAFERATQSNADAGPAAHIQLGYFVTPTFGIMATAALGGADDGAGAILTRHELGLELQSLPLALGPLHVGAYAGGGAAMSATDAGQGAAEWGGVGSAGALLELDLTGRLALLVRGGVDVARFNDGWSPAATVTGGVAIY